MAYIGKNPTFSTQSLTPLSADPANPIEGLTYYSDGTARTAGQWQYTGGGWVPLGSTASGTSAGELYNLGLSVSVAASALTIAIKQADGSTNPTVGSGVVSIGFRSSTLSSGGYVVREISSATSLVVSQGSSLGMDDATPTYLWVYALDNAGSVEIGVSRILYDVTGKVSTTAEGGAGGADSEIPIYSTSTLSNVPARVIGRILISEPTSAQWTVGPTEVCVLSQVPVPLNRILYIKHSPSSGTAGGQAISVTNNFALSNTPNFIQSGDTSFVTTDVSGNFITLSPGTYEVHNSHVFYRVGNCSSHFYDIAANVRYAKTFSCESDFTSGDQVIAAGGYDIFTITTAKDFNWRYVVDTSSVGSSGLGEPNGDGTREQYGLLIIRKLA